MKKYKELFIRSNNDFRKSFESTYNIELNDSEKEFFSIIKNIYADVDMYKKIEKMIKRND